MIAEKRILFCLEAGSHIGGGHLARCLTLAEALRRKGAKISFYCNEEAWDFKNLQNSGFARCDAEDLKPDLFDLIIIDHYGMNADDDRTLRPYTKKIMVIDDLANRSHDCDVLLDFSPSRQADDYKGLVTGECKFLTGIEYIILRSEFFKLAKIPPNKNTSTNIFLTMGSIDGARLLPRVLEVLENAHQIYNIHIMLTDKTKTLQSVEEHKEKSKHSIKLHKNLKNPASLMHSCDLAITAGGMTCLELVALSVPSLAVIVADNQIENVTTLDAKNLAKKIDALEEILLLLEQFESGNLKFDRLKVGSKMKIVSEIEKFL